MWGPRSIAKLIYNFNNFNITTESMRMTQDPIQKEVRKRTINIGLKNRPKIYGIGTSNQSVPDMAIDRNLGVLK